MRKVLILAPVLLLAVSVASAGNLATVLVQVSPLGRVIPKDFAGLSIEVPNAARLYLGPPGAPNRVFYRLLENLGTGIVRIGGNSTDRSCWNPGQAPHPNECNFTITQADVEGFAKASAATGWKMLVGVNLAQNSANWALPYGIAVAMAFANTPRSRLMGFEIGNEPDDYPAREQAPKGSSAALKNFFHSAPFRPASFGWRELASDWRPYVAAFASNPLTKDIPLAGPAYGGRKTFLDMIGPFIDAVGPGSFGWVTVHDYLTTTCGGRQPTVPQLLSAARLASYENNRRPVAAAVHERGLPIMLAETNSASCGGQAGVSDTFASTLWALDWLFTNFKLGMTAVDFHMAQGAHYDAVAARAHREADGNVRYTDTVMPLYYALYVFAQFAEGRSLLPVTTHGSGANLRVYAVRASSSSPVEVIVINKDLQASGNVVVHTSEAMGKAELLRVSAKVPSAGNVSFGGDRFDNQTGRLAGSPDETPLSPDSKRDYVVQIPDASIAVLTIDPK